MVSHMWEEWTEETRKRMAEETLYHGASRAKWVKLYVKEEGSDD